MPVGARDLCTVADVTGTIPGYASDAGTDAVLQDIVTAVSGQIQSQCSREVKAVSTNPQTRRFDIDEWTFSEREVFVGDLKNTTSLVVTIEDIDGTTLETVASTGYVLTPRNRQEWQPYNYIEFRSGMAGAPSSWACGRVVKVVGTFEFPSVPTDLKRAAVNMTIWRYISDVASSGTAFSDAVNESGFDPAAAFRWAMDVIDYYRFPTVA